MGDERYDLVFDLRPGLLRVQCKWGVRRGDVVATTCRTHRRGPNGFVVGVYGPDEIDAIAVYCSQVDSCYLLPRDLSIGRTGVYLRLAPSRNNQHHGINWARDYELGATLTRLRGP